MLNFAILLTFALACIAAWFAADPQAHRRLTRLASGLLVAGLLTCLSLQA